MNLPENDLRIPEAVVKAAARVLWEQLADSMPWRNYEDATEPYYINVELRRKGLEEAALAALTAAFQEMGFKEEQLILPEEGRFVSAGKVRWVSPWLPVESERQES